VKGAKASKPAKAAKPAKPRETKGAMVLAMIARPKGASLDDIVKATGWALPLNLAYATRASL
jgi:hypothetical protein